MRARDLKKKSIDEGILDAAYNVYKASDLGRQRAASAAEKSAQATFEKNIVNLLSRAILSGSVIQRQRPAPEKGTPTANNPFPKSASDTQTDAPADPKMPTANNPFPTNESKNYQIFDRLLETLVNEAGPQTVGNAPVSARNTPNAANPNSFVQSGNPTMAFKPGAIAQTINQYIVALARKYRWQDNTELKSNAERISREIEQELSSPDVFKKITSAIQQKNSQAIAQIIQTNTKDLTDQLFNTMYQWEQVGQDTGDSEQMQRYQAQLDKMSDFLKQASQNPDVLKTPAGQKYLEAMGILARQANKNDSTS